LAISIRHRAEAARPRSIRSVLFVATASAFVVVVAMFAASRSSVFSLRHLDIRGTGHRSVAEVRALAGVPPGANVVWLDTSAVVDRLERDPWIASATVTRSLPWSLDIAVTERRPVAVLTSVTGLGPGQLLAADGTLLGPAPEGTRLPVVTLPPAAPATLGLPGEDGAVRVLTALSPSVRHRVRQLDVGVGGTVTAVLRGGTSVSFGPAVDVRSKARMLRRVLAWERTTGTALGTVSLVAPTAPAATIGA
jgi:cell division protein FtsQ